MHNEDLHPTANKSILVSTAPPPTIQDVEEKIARLTACLLQGNDQIKQELAHAVPTYHPNFDHGTNASSTMRKAG